MYSINCTKIVSNASFFSSAVRPWVVCDFVDSLCIFRSGRNREKRLMLNPRHNTIITSPYHHALRVLYLSLLACVQTPPLLRKNRRGEGLYTGYAFASCQRKRKIKYRMIFRHRTLDPARMNVHVDLNFFWTFQKSARAVTFFALNFIWTLYCARISPLLLNKFLRCVA